MTGCLYLGPHGDYILTAIEIRPAANAGGPVGTSGSAGEPATMTGPTATAWKLEGQPGVDDGLLPYLLQKIEISLEPVPARSGTAGAVGTSGVLGAAAGNKPYRFKIKSIKRLSMEACS